MYEYKLITTENGQELDLPSAIKCLEKQVNRYCKEGFVPCGNLIAVSDMISDYLVQPMVKKCEDTTKNEKK